MYLYFIVPHLSFFTCSNYVLIAHKIVYLKSVAQLKQVEEFSMINVLLKYLILGYQVMIGYMSACDWTHYCPFFITRSHIVVLDLYIYISCQCAQCLMAQHQTGRPVRIVH